MPNKQKTHEDCRLLCCILCKRTLKDNRKLSVGNKILVKTNFVPNFDDVHQFLPGGLCGEWVHKTVGIACAHAKSVFVYSVYHVTPWHATCIIA